MKTYRAIEFSKLLFLLDETGQAFWDNKRLEYRDNPLTGKEGTNWWMHDSYKDDRRKVISHICKNGKEQFFDTSLQYNAMQGGRFNPSKSFGVIYSASSPMIAALEVLFHLFADSYPIYRGMSRSSSKISCSFNAKVPDKIQVIIPVFEMSLHKDFELYDLCSSLDALNSDCQKVGFKRYLGQKFSRDFIFGNDYEISRIIGCHRHTQKVTAFKVPSARIDFEIQDDLDHRNIIVPEKDFDEAKPKLTGKFVEFRCEIDMDPSSKHGHKVKLVGMGQNEEVAEFYLQPIPTKKHGDLQTIRYPPVNASKKDQDSYSRIVQVQKFYVPTPEEETEEA